MADKISVVINTLNEEENIQKVIASASWADEIVVCDMHSTDKTAEFAKKAGVRVFFYPNKGFVEPARNFAISKASNDWILLLDADEEAPKSLVEKLKSTINLNQYSFVNIPRKNIIFGKWMKASMWWPDYNIRFFRKGSVNWGNKIHQKPQTYGEGIFLEEKEEYAILHHNYQSISQYIDRMNRYTAIQARELKEEGYQFYWFDLLQKPLNEFLSRFFDKEGFKDGLHGLYLSLLQAFSFLVVYLKVWEMEKFTPYDINLQDLKEKSIKLGQDVDYWFDKKDSNKNPLYSLFSKIKKQL